MQFPQSRLRRLRRSEPMRRLVQESALAPEDLVCPLFVEEGAAGPSRVASMPGISRVPPELAAAEAAEIAELGIPAVMLFGIPSSKDDEGSGAYDDGGAVQRAARSIRGRLGERLVVMADVCLCQYTSSGHCGIASEGAIDNDASLGALARAAVSLARAGAHVVSPSAMMDGQVAAIRAALDGAGLHDAAIMPHSAKHASAFYAPFRDAASCAPRFGDRASYQVPWTNAREAMREVDADVREGADIIMIKPALAYLDLVRAARERHGLPVAAYSVSGEYALVKAAAERGMVPEREIVAEILGSIKRAGADMIVTYFAREAAAAMRR